jgi:hypothetical protein
MIRTVRLFLAIATVTFAFAPPISAQDVKPQWRITLPDQPAAPAPAPTFRMQPVTAPTPAPTFRMQPVTAPTPAPAVDCAGMNSRLDAAISAFNASCGDQRFRGQVQQCITMETENLAAAQQLLPHTGTCKPWTAAEVRKVISVARKNLALFNETMAAGNSPRGRRGGGGGYSGPNNNYVGPDIGYSACQRFMIQADGSKYCY